MICWSLPAALQRTHGNGKLLRSDSALACRWYDRNAHVRAALGLTRILLVSLHANRFEAARREIFFFSGADSGSDKGMTRHATPARWLAGWQRPTPERREPSCFLSGASGDAREERRRPPCLPPTVEAQEATPGRLSSNGHDSRSCVREAHVHPAICLPVAAGLINNCGFCSPSPPPPLFFFPFVL